MKTIFPLLVLAALVVSNGSSEGQEAVGKRRPLKEVSLPDTRNVHVSGAVYLAGQPSREALTKLAENGVKTVITLRHAAEDPWNEKQVCEDLGMKFLRYPVSSPKDLNAKLFESVRKHLLAAKKDAGVLLHCASANRVGAVWLTHLVKDAGLELPDALKESKEVGLSSPVLEQQSLEYLGK